MSGDLRERLARVIWETSRADESTISATGANHVADAILPLIHAEREKAAAQALTDAADAVREQLRQRWGA